MKTNLIVAPWEEIDCDILILPVFEEEDLDSDLATALNEKLDGLLEELLSSQEWKGENDSIVVLHRPDKVSARRLLLAGCGKKEHFDASVARKVTTAAVRKVRSSSLKKVVFYCRDDISLEDVAQAAVEGINLAAFEGDSYKTKDRKTFYIEEVSVGTSQPADQKRLEQILRRGLILTEATNLAREITNQPGNRVGPRDMVDRAKKVAQAEGLDIEVLEEKDLEELGMNALLAVGQGSHLPPRLIILTHKGAESEAPLLALVGKGVTFDSGGLSLKPPSSMEEMKSDKAGACVVLAAMQAIARLNVKSTVVGVLPCVENLPGGRAQRPGDVIQSFSGKTIEVLNTDAEGRLILADALSYCVRNLKARHIVDIATLTGACLVALGHVRAGLFSNDHSLSRHLIEASRTAGEPVWEMPMDRIYREQIESDIADVKNVGGKWAGAITAAKFLEEFVDGIPWCHLDIAGVDLFKEKEEQKGPTGFGVRILAELAERLAAWPED